MQITQLAGKTIERADLMELLDPITDQTDVILTLTFDDGDTVNLVAGDVNAEHYYTALDIVTDEEIAKKVARGHELSEPPETFLS